MLGQKVTLGAAGNAGGDSYWYFQFQSTTQTGTGYDVVTDVDNNIYVAGEIYDSYYNWSGHVYKLDKDGNLQANRMLRTVYQESLRGIAHDGSNGIFVAGHTGATSSGYLGAFVSKLDLNLQNQWYKHVEAPSAQMRYHDVDCDSLGNVVVGGWSGYHGNGGRESWIQKLDTNGSNLWQRSFGDVYDQEITAISHKSDDNIYYSGWNTYSANDGEIVNINSNGNVNFYNNVSDNGIQRVWDITHDSRDYYYAVGQFYNYSYNLYDSFIMQFNMNNSFIQQQYISYSSGGQNIYAKGVATDSQDNVYVLTWANNGGQFEPLITKYNKSLGFQWSRAMVTNSANTYPERITCDSNDNVIITGKTEAYGGTQNSFVLKYPSDGSLTGTFTSGVYTVVIRNPTGVTYGFPTLSISNLGYGQNNQSNSLGTPNGYGNVNLTLSSHQQDLS